MKELIALIVIYLIFLACSLLLYRKAIYLNSKWLYLWVPIYILAIYFYFEFINFIHVYVRGKGFYMELGHASISLAILMLLAYLTGIILLLFLIIRKRKQNQATHK